MPRMQITYPNINDDLIALHVGWTNETPGSGDGQTQVIVEIDIKLLDALRKEHANSTSLFIPVDLYRSTVNATIRTLKIARDKAYGRDE